MASVSITIGDPTLGVGEKFRTRHRLLPSGVFTSWTDRTNAPFSLTGLVAGTYQLEVVYVKDNGTECASVIKSFNVVEVEEPETYECPDFTVTQLSNPARLSISYTGGTGSAPCGYAVRYRAAAASPWVAISYITLPASPFTISLPSGNQALTVQILTNTCDGLSLCEENSVLPPAPPECTEIQGFDYVVTPIEQPMQAKKAYRITLTATTQSTIPTTSATFRIDQGYTLSPALPWGASFPVTGISPTAFSVTFVVYHNFPYGAPTPPIYWVLKFNDACGYLHNININYP